MSFNVIDLSMCFVYKTCKFFLPLSVITQVINVLNGIWRHHLLSNKVRQNGCPLILDNNHSKFSIICVRFMYKYFFPFFNPTPFVFLKDISCLCWSRLRLRRINKQARYLEKGLRVVNYQTTYSVALIQQYRGLLTKT